MNRVLRAGCILLGLLVIAGAAAWSLTGGGTYVGSPDYYPVTVRLWLADSFVGGIAPAVPAPTSAASVLEMLAAGNDLIFVDGDAPRCPVWSVAWVSPRPGTPPDAQVYNATIRCAQPEGAAPAPTGRPDDGITLRELLEQVGP